MPLKLQLVDDRPILKFEQRAPLKLVLGDSTAVTTDGATTEGTGQVTSPIKVKTLKAENFPAGIIDHDMLGAAIVENGNMGSDSVGEDELIAQSVGVPALKPSLAKRIPPDPGNDANRGRSVRVGPDDALRYVDPFDAVHVDADGALEGDGTTASRLDVKDGGLVEAMYGADSIPHGALQERIVEAINIVLGEIGFDHLDPALQGRTVPTGYQANQILAPNSQATALVWQVLSGGLLTDGSVIFAKLSPAVQKRLAPALTGGTVGQVVQIGQDSQNNKRLEYGNPPISIQAQAPAPPTKGYFWYSTTEDLLYYGNGDQWLPLVKSPYVPFASSKAASGSNIALRFNPRSDASSIQTRSRATSASAWTDWADVSGSGPTTGEATVSGTLSHEWQIASVLSTGRREISALARREVWYGAGATGLYTIDPATPSAALIGAFHSSVSGVQALGIGPNKDGDEVLLLAHSNKIARINPADPDDQSGDYGDIGAIPNAGAIQGLTYDANRKRWVAMCTHSNSANAGFLWHLNPDDATDQTGDYGEIRNVPSGFIGPSDIAGSLVWYPPDNNYYAIQYTDDQLWRWTGESTGGFASLGSLPSGLGSGQGLAAALFDGRLLASDNSGQELWRVDPTDPDNATAPYGEVGDLNVNLNGMCFALGSAA